MMTPDEIKTLRQEIEDDCINRGHLTLMCLQALDEIEVLRHYSKSCPCPHCLGCRKHIDCVNREEGNEVERLKRRLTQLIAVCRREPAYCGACGAITGSDYCGHEPLRTKCELCATVRGGYKAGAETPNPGDES